MNERSKEDRWRRQKRTTEEWIESEAKKDSERTTDDYWESLVWSAVSLICWGSWANTQKAAQMKVRFSLSFLFLLSFLLLPSSFVWKVLISMKGNQIWTVLLGFRHWSVSLCPSILSYSWNDAIQVIPFFLFASLFCRNFFFWRRNKRKSPHIFRIFARSQMVQFLIRLHCWSSLQLWTSISSISHLCYHRDLRSETDLFNGWNCNGRNGRCLSCMGWSVLYFFSSLDRFLLSNIFPSCFFFFFLFVLRQCVEEWVWAQCWRTSFNLSVNHNCCFLEWLQVFLLFSSTLW